MPHHRTPSPWVTLPRDAWAALRSATPLTLTEDDVEALRGTAERLSLDEVAEVYLPMSRLLNLYVAARQDLHRVTDTFLGSLAAKVPFVIGVAGSVAVGKSTTSRILQALLARWPDHPEVALVTTDGFLLPNAELERRGLMDRKGFPESYDVAALVRFVAAVKSGEPEVRAPVYSHLTYDVVPDEKVIIRQPDVLIVEGLNVLQSGSSADDTSVPARGATACSCPTSSTSRSTSTPRRRTSNAGTVERFRTLRETAFRDPRSYFSRYADLDDEAADATAADIWRRINGRNLRDNVLPTRTRADLILQKGPDHRVEQVLLRKL